MTRVEIKLKGYRWRILRALFILLLLFNGRVKAQQMVWMPHAPGPTINGQVENIKDGEVSGAINAVAVHPTDSNVVFVGTVNGGIWKTSNAMAAKPTWETNTDNQSSLSIGALEYDTKDPTHRTLIAGIGRFSSFENIGGALSGLLRTTNNGKSWIAINGKDTLNNLNISGVASRGDTILISVNKSYKSANYLDTAFVGIWRSTNTGKSWRKVSGRLKETGLPSGASFGLTSDPTNPKRLFTNAGKAGIYQSLNFGTTWSKISNVAMDNMIADAANIKISVGGSKNIFVAVVTPSLEKGPPYALVGFFYSDKNYFQWKTVSLPKTAEGGLHPGGQGNIHFSLIADPKSPDIVYLGGDRQEPGPQGFTNGNSIGAKEYTGLLFRGDVSKPLDKQWVHLTHSNLLGASGGGTRNNSAPHADSRDMAIAANGVLIEVNDGGIYRRTSPQTNQGDWFSMNGNIQTTEFHSIAWDANTNTIIGGAQDTGSSEQEQPNNVKWNSVLLGDGGVVAINDFSVPDTSTRFSSQLEQNNKFFLVRDIFDAKNNLQLSYTIFPTSTSGDSIIGRLYTPIKLNNVEPYRMIIGGEHSVYESFNEGAFAEEIFDEHGQRLVVNATYTSSIAYGAVGNPEVLYVGSGNSLYIRKSASPEPLRRSTSYNGGWVAGIAIDPNNPNSAFVVDFTRVYHTANGDTSWTEITGNLPKFSPGELFSITYSNHTPEGAIIIGTENGVYMASGSNYTDWTSLGAKLPKVPVMSLEYDAVDRILLAGTLGRGAFTLKFPEPLLVHGNLVNRTNYQTNKPLIVEDVNIQKSSKQNSFELFPGVIIEPNKSRAFIMSPNGGIEAVKLSTGEKMWYTAAATKPLGVVKKRLISQVENLKPDNNLKIVALNPANGHTIVSAQEELPSDVNASVIKSSKGEFVANSYLVNNDLIVAWQFVEPDKSRNIKRGVLERTRGKMPAQEEINFTLPKGDTSLTNIKSGAFRLKLSNGETTPIDQPAELNNLNSLKNKASFSSKLISGSSSPQFISADGLHILVSQPTNNNAVSGRYTLRIYERDSKKQLGEFKSPFPFVNFIVKDNIVIYQTQPYTIRTKEGLKKEPLKVRALDLKTSKELWSQEVRDTTYRGPMPP
ncbi:WD40/YVTN/BNR-like repeat-containing protein [Rufibacter tibetensis]|uniref:WD40/YVTN/BNR-like repeat-containing protein n=1 Tax=Rufibacter tibetensis TaxID=512763 RepID=UPI0007835F38|nr:hypothetical protein [Rufibacter tibetensis]